MQSHCRYPQARQPTRHFRRHGSRDRQRSRVCRRSLRRFLQREGCQQQVPMRLLQLGANQQTVVSLQRRPMFLRGWSRRKPELSYRQHSPSAGPCRQLSSGRWALSEPLSIELADTDWKYESALARSHHPRSLRDTAAVLRIENGLSPAGCTRRTSRRCANRFGWLAPLRWRIADVPERGRRCRCGRWFRCAALARRPTMRPGALQGADAPPGCSRRKPELPYQQRSHSAGPCRQLSSGQWALSELL